MPFSIESVFRRAASELTCRKRGAEKQTSTSVGESTDVLVSETGAAGARSRSQIDPGSDLRSEPGLVVVVELELERGRAQARRLDLVVFLPVDPLVDHLGREDVALQQEGVILLEVVDGLLERARGLRDVL